MRLWPTRTDTRSALRRKAASRMERLATPAILDWADQAGSGLAKALDDYRRYQTPESLVDAREGAEALSGCLDALQARR